MKRKFSWIAITVVVCSALMVTAFLVGRLVHSPHEQAIANATHVPVVTAKVEQRSVQEATIDLQGTLSLGSSWNVTVNPSEGVLPVVTETYLAPGEALTSGSLLAGVSGRPVIGMQLPFVLYRDIHGGDSGDDVREIQRALQSLGLYSGAIDGQYGARTALAVESLYTRLNVAKPSPEQSALAGLETTQEALNQAQIAATAAPDDQAAAAALASAQKALSSAKTAVLTPVLRSEIIALPANTVTVVALAPINTQIGADTPLASLRSGQATVVARISVADKDTFAVGTDVSISAVADTQTKTTGAVTSIGAFTQELSGKSAVPGYDITVEVSDPAGLDDGQDVVVTSGETGVIEGLAVPVTALRQDGDTTYVVMADSDTHVPVDVRIVSDGFAILDATSLKAGDTVVVSQS